MHVAVCVLASIAKVWGWFRGSCQLSSSQVPQTGLKLLVPSHAWHWCNFACVASVGVWEFERGVCQRRETHEYCSHTL